MNRAATAGRDHQSDILIMGGGPAGCAAAISARLAGLSVTLLHDRLPAGPIPGETLHPGVEPIFKSLGVWDAVLDQGFHRHRGIWREDLTGNRTFNAYGSDQSGPWLGFQVDRVRLDKILLSRARDLGTDVMLSRKLSSVPFGHCRYVSGIRVDQDIYHFRSVLDATGRRSWLACQLGLIPEAYSPMQRIQFGWSRNAPPELDGQPLFQQQKNGWSWISPLGDGRYAWVRLRRGAGPRGLDYRWRIFRECAGPDYFLVGDAACLMDPSSANGVLRAMMSGIYATHLISATNQGRVTREEAFAAYKRWIADMFDRTRMEFIHTEILHSRHVGIGSTTFARA